LFSWAQIYEFFFNYRPLSPLKMQKAGEDAAFFHFLPPKLLPESRNLLPFLPMAARVTEILRIFADVMTNERISNIRSISRACSSRARV
jgi:hypothetical protein